VGWLHHLTVPGDEQVTAVMPKSAGRKGPSGPSPNFVPDVRLPWVPTKCGNADLPGDFSNVKGRGPTQLQPPSCPGYGRPNRPLQALEALDHRPPRPFAGDVLHPRNGCGGKMKGGRKGKVSRNRGPPAAAYIDRAAIWVGRSWARERRLRYFFFPPFFDWPQRFANFRGFDVDPLAKSQNGKADSGVFYLQWAAKGCA